MNKFLTEHFTSYVDYDFTAKLEDELDAVSRGEKDWLPLMREFWDPFSARIKDKEGGISRDEAVSPRNLGNDPETGRSVTVRMGRYGAYVQIGARDDEEKPKFANLRADQRMDSIGLDEGPGIVSPAQGTGRLRRGRKDQRQRRPLRSLRPL